MYAGMHQTYMQVYNTCVQKLNTVCHLFRYKLVSNMTALYVPQNRLKSLEQNTDEGTVDVHRNKM